MAYITKRANGWRAQVERMGSRLSMVHPTKAAAQAWATAVEADLLAKRRGGLPRKTVADALTKYGLEVSPKKRGNDWEQKRLAVFKREPWAVKLLADLSSADLAAWRDRRLLGVTGGTVLRDATLLRAVFNVARKEWGWLRENPFDGVELPPDNKPRDRRVAPHEVRAICRALGYVTGQVKTKQQQVALAFLISLRTGMRSGEVLSLTPELVDLKGRVADLMKTKNGDPRRVPLSRAATRLFTGWTGWTVTRGSRDALFRKARKRAGVTGLVYHDSRAEALTRISKKLNVFELARVSGHRDLKTLMDHYYRETPEQIAQKL